MRLMMAVCLTVLLVTGCSDTEIGDSVVITNSGICGQYLGYKGGAYIVKSADDGYHYSISSEDYSQIIVVVDTCDR